MRRRSERKKSTDVLSPPTAPKRSSGRRSHRSSSSQSESCKSSKPEEATASNDIVNEESNTSTVEKTNERQLRRRRSCSSPRVEEKKKSPLREQPELEAIPELPADNNSESPDEIRNEINSTSPKQTEREQTPENGTSENKENHAEIAPASSPKAENTEKVIEREESPEKVARKSDVEIELEEAVKQKENDTETTTSEDSVPEKQTKTEREQNISPEKETPAATTVEHKKTFSRSRERRSHVVEKANDEPENDENKEFNNKSPKKTSIFVTPSNEKTQNTRKRRWLSKRSSDSNSQILAISTDSLKNLISDVHPVPLCDVKLESSSDVEEVESEREEGEASPTPQKPRSAKSSSYERERKPSIKYEQPTRKISIVNDGYEMVPPIPTKKEISNILYITNLVRPFTILQLKGLLARTGKIVENRFWIDKIKSKCYVQYETEDEAVETRHALHGVRWPTSNPKCLNVDFGTDAEMEKAMATTQEGGPQYGQDIGRENRIIGTGWDRDRFDFEEKKVQVGRPVREWDVGKREELESEAERAREREKRREGERSERVIHNERADKDNVRGRDRGDRDRDRDRDRKRHSSDRDHRRSLSASPARKIKKKSNDPPLRLLDDLFRKTKTTPCIYWLPLTPEQIAEKEAFRLRRIAEQQERIKLRELEKEKEREKERDREREREKDRRRERDRSNGHRRSLSRDRRRY